MMRLLFFLLLLPFFLFARENPFFPAEGEVEMPFSSNVSQDLAPLKRATLTLPSTARVIEKMSVTYKNLDGSITTKSIQLNNSVDWHLPLFLSQNYGMSPKRTKTDIQKNEKFKKLASLAYVSLYAKKREIKLQTQDELIRDFLLPKPHRIVCDFKRDIEIRSFTKNISDKSIVKRFRVGNHDGYYRVVIELDGYYRYKLEKTESGYLFKLL